MKWPRYLLHTKYKVIHFPKTIEVNLVFLSWSSLHRSGVLCQRVRNIMTNESFKLTWRPIIITIVVVQLATFSEWHQVAHLIGNCRTIAINYFVKEINSTIRFCFVIEFKYRPLLNPRRFLSIDKIHIDNKESFKVLTRHEKLNRFNSRG